MNAQEAATQSLEINRKSKNLRKLFNEIYTKSKSGRYEVFTYLKLNENEKTTLKRLGYKISLNNSSINERIISW